MNRDYYLELFYRRWDEMESKLPLEDKDGSHHLLDKDIFHKFFVNPEILVGFYMWRDFSYEEFMEEYDGWADDCKEIAAKAKEIFEQIK